MEKTGLLIIAALTIGVIALVLSIYSCASLKKIEAKITEMDAVVTEMKPMLEQIKPLMPQFEILNELMPRLQQLLLGIPPAPTE